MIARGLDLIAAQLVVDLETGHNVQDHASARFSLGDRCAGPTSPNPVMT